MFNKDKLGFPVMAKSGEMQIESMCWHAQKL